jgi:5-methyltetrahydropteroyltriglutamate--homocysteine methyltransferase
MTSLFPSQEIGSLAKPRWRTRGIKQQLSSEDLREAEEWAEKLKLPAFHDKAKSILKESDAKERTRVILELSTEYGVRLLETAGLDNVGVGGEQQRVEMYEHVIRAVEGMSFLGHVQSFDYKYFRKAVALEALRRKHPIYLDEFADVRKYAHGSAKVPITGPYTLVDWSFNEYYLAKQNGSNLKERKNEARREFLLEMVEKVLRPEIRDLVDAGAKWIQIDEPAVTTHPEPVEMGMFVEAWNETVKGFSCKFSNHTCYPSEIGYKILAEYAPKMDKCSQLALEFANRDSARLGTKDSDRTGYESLRSFVENGFDDEFGLGVVHVHDFAGDVSPGAGVVQGRNIIETPDLVKDRILYASKIVGDPAKIWVNPDCGLRTRTWDVALEKLRSVVGGAGLAREALG